MKEKKIGRILILVAFFVMCFLNVIYFVAGRFIDSKNYENRNMAEKPSFTMEGYADFSKQYTAYYNDNLPFRRKLITLNSEIDLFVFNRASNDSVVIGKDNWLFYKTQKEDNPIADYRGQNLYSDEELKKIADNCIKQRDYVEDHGGEFVIFIAPNKERVYSEYMPDFYGKPAENYRVKQVYDYLKENTDIRIVYPYQELMEAKEKTGYYLYYKTDTHWNSVGAYIGSVALLKELGIEMPSVYSDEINIEACNNTAGDLANMLNLREQLADIDGVYKVSGYDEHNTENVEYDYTGMISYHSENADTRRILILRDSFCVGMAPYIGSQFNDSYMFHRNYYTYQQYLDADPDIVVFQVVERYVDSLGTFSIEK